MEVSYQITCSCGHVLNGSRQSNYQIVRCPRCGSDRFVFPRSPFLEAGEKSASPQQPKSGIRLSLRLWLAPVLATIVTAAGFLIIYLIFLRPDNPSGNGSKGKETRPAQERLLRAEKYLGEGSFQLAADELACSPAENLNGRQARRWRQLQREASLLADLSAEPLEDILRHAAGVADKEWQAGFPRRYLGKGFLFDIQVQRLPAGHVRANYTLPGPDPIRLDWGELEVFHDMDLDQPRRMILGVRLARVGLEPPGPAWVVHFQPQSGVLLTDARAAALCCPPLGEPDALAILKKQEQIVGE